MRMCAESVATRAGEMLHSRFDPGQPAADGEVAVPGHVNLSSVAL